MASESMCLVICTEENILLFFGGTKYFFKKIKFKKIKILCPEVRKKRFH